eukprot:m.17036 g.17036  ORF g.17036 m.17036 type:complete len:383 (+) comp10918_c0_seq1:269-1417(+)
MIRRPPSNSSKPVAEPLRLMVKFCVAVTIGSAEFTIFYFGSPLATAVPLADEGAICLEFDAKALDLDDSFNTSGARVRAHRQHLFLGLRQDKPDVGVALSIHKLQEQVLNVLGSLHFLVQTQNDHAVALSEAQLRQDIKNSMYKLKVFAQEPWVGESVDIPSFTIVGWTPAQKETLNKWSAWHAAGRSLEKFPLDSSCDVDVQIMTSLWDLQIERPNNKGGSNSFELTLETSSTMQDFGVFQCWVPLQSYPIALKDSDNPNYVPASRFMADYVFGRGPAQCSDTQQFLINPKLAIPFKKSDSKGSLHACNHPFVCLLNAQSDPKLIGKNGELRCCRPSHLILASKAVQETHQHICGVAKYFGNDQSQAALEWWRSIHEKFAT